MDQSSVAGIELARAIQCANFDYPDALNWLFEVVYMKLCSEDHTADSDGFWFWTKVTFEHSKNNAKDAWRHVSAKKAEIISNRGNLVIQPGLLWCERIDKPPFDIYVGKPDIRGHVKLSNHFGNGLLRS